MIRRVFTWVFVIAFAVVGTVIGLAMMAGRATGLLKR